MARTVYNILNDLCVLAEKNPGLLQERSRELRDGS